MSQSVRAPGFIVSNGHEMSQGGAPSALAAVVTGASRGIGIDVARELVDNGVRVLLTARTRDAIHQTVHAQADDMKPSEYTGEG